MTRTYNEYICFQLSHNFPKANFTGYYVESDFFSFGEISLLGKLFSTFMECHIIIVNLNPQCIMENVSL